MSSLGILAAGVAHEINNPLNYIYGGVTIIENYLDENNLSGEDEITLSLEAMKTGIARTTKIVKNLNDYVGHDIERREDCDLHLIIENCLTMLNGKLKDKIKIQKKYTEEDFNVEGSIGELHQVFINLLINAEQAIKDKGIVHITTEIIEKNIKISITDTGQGIEPEILTKITDPFFTTKEPGEGTGLGLSISQKIIFEHGGSLYFESEDGNGTVAVVELPVI